MELMRTPLRKSRKPRSWRFIWLLLAFTSVGILAYYWVHYYPNYHHINPRQQFHGLDKPIFYKGKMQRISAAGSGASLKLPISVIQKWIDSAAVYEEKSDSVILTTKNKVLRMKTDQLTGTMNEKPFSLRFPIENINDSIFVPVEPLKGLYGLTVKEDAKTGTVVLFKAGDLIQWGKADASDHDEKVPLRTKPTIKAPIAADLSLKQQVMIWNETDGWYYVQLENGYTGYVSKKSIVLDRVESLSAKTDQSKFIPWKPLGGKINLTWEQVYKNNPDFAKIGAMPGLNAVSPTWFQLADGNGNLYNIADSAYVQSAHQRQLHVWALFSNGFEPEQTSKALSTYDNRMKMIKQLLAFAQMYKLQGINIDFENVYLKDKNNLTQFIREMTPLMHEQGLVVSIDVTVKSSSEVWSMFCDREAIGKIVDYMMVMTYDEHWAGGPEAGSVASLPWVEQGIKRIMREDHVPASKLVLGIPYYTRIWSEQSVDGKTKVTSKAVSMDKVQNIIKSLSLKPRFSRETGQNYVEYKEDGVLRKIWIEDTVSVKARAELVKKLDLAGISSWRRGFETPDIWGVIKNTLEKRP